MAAPGEALTPSGYITHHLTNLAVGDGGFWTVHIDSLFFSVLTGLAFLWGFPFSGEKGYIRSTR